MEWKQADSRTVYAADKETTLQLVLIHQPEGEDEGELVRWSGQIRWKQIVLFSDSDLGKDLERAKSVLRHELRTFIDQLTDDARALLDG